MLYVKVCDLFSLFCTMLLDIHKNGLHNYDYSFQNLSNEEYSGESQFGKTSNA